MSPLTLKLFGNPQVNISGKEITGFHSNKARALLFYLAVTGRIQARTVLAGLFWGEFPDRRAMSNLRKTLSNLRKLAGDYLDIERSWVNFDQSSDYWLDVAVFKAQLKRLESGRDLEAAEYAVSLYKGEFLEGFYLEGAPEWENWALAERQRLRQGYHQALQELAHHYAETGDYLQAIHNARSLLRREPLREDIQRLLMTLYARNDQRARALSQYKTCQQILADELGVEPASETVALAEAIRTGAIGPPEKIPSGGSQHPASDLVPQSPDFLEDASRASEDDRRLFIGREQELEILEEQLAAARAGDGRVFFVTGEAGRGKSALLAEFTRRALKSHPDLVVAAGNCNAFSGAGDPFHPFREIIDQLAGDVEARWRAGTISREQARRVWELLPVTTEILTTSGPGLLSFFVSTPVLLERLSAFASQDLPELDRLRKIIENREAGRLEADQLLSQFAHVLINLAHKHPLLLTLDDLQWVDNASA